MAQNALKMAPYGESNFAILRANNLAYVDKTEFIAKLESFANRFPFIVRPRRFGKTLFTQTLQAYYDIAAAKDFERNFAGTYIGEHKTPLANTFRVMHLDFSGIDAEIFTEGFVVNVRDGLLDFSLRNNFKEGTELLQRHYLSPTLLLADFLFVYRQHFTDPIYLIIDE